MTDAPDGSLATDEERATLLAAYDAQLRGAAEVQGAVSWDRSGPLWRALFQRERVRQLRVARGSRQPSKRSTT